MGYGYKVSTVTHPDDTKFCMFVSEAYNHANELIELGFEPKIYKKERFSTTWNEISYDELTQLVNG